MSNRQLFFALSLTGAILASNIADGGLFDDKIKARQQSGQELTQDYVNFLKILDAPFCYFFGMTRLKDYIVIPCCQKASLKSIRLYQDTSPFDLLMLILLEEISIPFNLISNAASECLYITDLKSSCIWKVKMEDQQVTKWLCNLTEEFRVTVSTDGQVVVLHPAKMLLEIYGADATFVRRVRLSNDVYFPYESFPNRKTEFMIVHPWKSFQVYSQVTTKGKEISQVSFIHTWDTAGTEIRPRVCWSFNSDELWF